MVKRLYQICLFIKEPNGYPGDCKTMKLQLPSYLYTMFGKNYEILAEGLGIASGKKMENKF